MNRIKKLVFAYGKYIEIPWIKDASASERIIFCVYDPSDELRLRAKIDEFEIVTRGSGHGWEVFDLTNTFAKWLSKHDYAESYFRKPEFLVAVLHEYLDFIAREFEQFLAQNKTNENFVVALKGVGTLFGFLKIKGLVDRLAPLAAGRLLVFFPGNYENNNYRLLDAYDGWNYLAVPITADMDF